MCVAKSGADIASVRRNTEAQRILNARELDIHKTTLYRKMKALGLLT